MSDDYGGCTTDSSRARLLYCGGLQKIPKGSQIIRELELNREKSDYERSKGKKEIEVKIVTKIENPLKRGFYRVNRHYTNKCKWRFQHFRNSPILLSFFNGSSFNNHLAQQSNREVDSGCIATKLLDFAVASFEVKKEKTVHRNDWSF